MNDAASATPSARMEIEHLRGVTKSKLLAQPVAWMVYLPSIDTQHLYYSQEDMGYVDDVTNHADAEVTPLYEMAAPKAEVAPAGEYPAITTEFINKHAHPSQAAKLCRADWSGKDESSVETVHPEVIKLLHAYADADRDMRVQDDSDALTVAYMSGFERGKDAAKSQAAPSQDAEDAARLDWLASKSQVNIQRVHYPDDDRSTFEVTPYDCDSFEGDTLREAIDAARAQQEGK